jgi:LPS export ABC transporter protein LptC
MSKALRRARLFVALFAIVFVVFVAFAFRNRPAAPDAVSPPARLDPDAVVESTGGTSRRFTGEREDVQIHYEHQFTYADGTSRLEGVTIVSTREGRVYTVTANEAQLGKEESSVTLTGHVHIVSDDGLAADTEHATYTDESGVVNGQGPVSFSRGRLDGNGVGMTYDTKKDVLTILSDAMIDVAPADDGAGAIDVVAGRMAFPRASHQIQLERGVTMHRDGREIVADQATAYLTDDEERMTRLELRGGSRVTTEAPQAGALQVLSGRDIDLKYAENGASLEHAHVDGDGAMQFAGDAGRAGRRIAAAVLDVALGPDGSTLVGLRGREAVRLTFPQDGATPARSVNADQLDGDGAPDRGLTRARFTGRVAYRERRESERVVTAGALDASLAPATGEIEDASFRQAVHMTDGDLEAFAAAARYRVGDGVVELTGTEPAHPVPNVQNAQIDVRATRVDVTLDGPVLHAAGDVKSAIKSAKDGDGGTKVPAMLHGDEPITVTADELRYDGTRSEAVYTGRAWLWQGETSVKGDTITLDGDSGDLAASGTVTTTTVLDEKAEDGTTSKTTTVATAKDFAYADGPRRATYTGAAHLSGPGRDMTADKVELFLNEAGDAVDRMEAYDNITLRESQRKTTGARMTYTASDERYVVTGAPATILDECGRETVGQRVSFVRASDTVTVDGGTQRAVTRGGTCTP